MEHQITSREGLAAFSRCCYGYPKGLKAYHSQKRGGAVGRAGKKRRVFSGRSFDIDYLHVRRKNNDLARGNSFIQGSGLLELRRATECE